MPSNIAIYYCVPAFIVLMMVVSALNLGRRKKDYSEYLEPPLRMCGFKFISAVQPGAFKAGPFPKYEIDMGLSRGNVDGSYSEYRIVSFSNLNGDIFQLWARIEFQISTFRRVHWRAQRKEAMPPGVLSLLEK